MCFEMKTGHSNRRILCAKLNASSPNFQIGLLLLGIDGAQSLWVGLSIVEPMLPNVSRFMRPAFLFSLCGISSPPHCFLLLYLKCICQFELLSVDSKGAFLCVPF